MSKIQTTGLLCLYPAEGMDVWGMPCIHTSFAALWDLFCRAPWPQASRRYVAPKRTDKASTKLEPTPHQHKQEMLSNNIHKISLDAEESCFNNRISHKPFYPQASIIHKWSSKPMKRITFVLRSTKSSCWFYCLFLINHSCFMASAFLYFCYYSATVN